MVVIPALPGCQWTHWTVGLMAQPLALTLALALGLPVALLGMAVAVASHKLTPHNMPVVVLGEKGPMRRASPLAVMTPTSARRLVKGLAVK